jgi:hypothetical protein
MSNQPNERLAREAAIEAREHVIKALYILEKLEPGIATDHLEAARDFIANALIGTRWTDASGQQHCL